MKISRTEIYTVPWISMCLRLASLSEFHAADAYISACVVNYVSPISLGNEFYIFFIHITFIFVRLTFWCVKFCILRHHFAIHFCITSCWHVVKVKVEYSEKFKITQKWVCAFFFFFFFSSFIDFGTYVPSVVPASSTLHTSVQAYLFILGHFHTKMAHRTWHAI